MISALLYTEYVSAVWCFEERYSDKIVIYICGFYINIDMTLKPATFFIL